MSSIPLPALAIQPQQQQNPLGDASKLLALRSMMNQQTLQQQQIQDQQATTQAMKDWDPKTQTYDDLAKMVLKNNGSANAAMGVTQHGLQVQQAVQSLNKDKLDNFIKAHQTVGDTLNGVLNLPDDQLHDGATKAVKSLADAGIMDPQTAATSAQQIQATTDPTALRQQISNVAKVSLGAKAVADQQKTAAETNASNAKAALDQAQTWLDTNKANVIKAYQQNPQQLLSQIDAIAPPNGPNAALNARTKSQVQFALGNGDVDGAKAALKQAADQVGAVEKDVQVATNPQIQQGKEQVAAVEGASRANVEAAMARGSNAALAQVPPHLIGPATAAATKAGEDFAQAQSVSDRLQAMMDAAKNGNVVSYQLIPQEGALQVTTSQGVHRINMAEIQNYGGGSLWQRLEGHIGKQLTGESIPDSVLSDMSDMQQIQQKGSAEKYNNSLKTINQTYGAKFQPVQMDNTTSKPAASPAKQSATPQGADRTAMGSDGKRHYTNAQGQDLGVVP
jgi:hypothetical protein